MNFGPSKSKNVKILIVPNIWEVKFSILMNFRPSNDQNIDFYLFLICKSSIFSNFDVQIFKIWTRAKLGKCTIFRSLKNGRNLIVRPQKCKFPKNFNFNSGWRKNWQHCNTQCGNVMIFLSHRFYVKSIMETQEVLNLQF